MIIPIGVDCGIADFCIKYGLRTCAFPFDWIVSYNGVSKCIEDNFASFIPEENERLNKYDMSFVHHFSKEKYEEDKIKYLRRCDRFMTILETSEEVIFFRKGHGYHLHNEHNGKFINIISDINDAEELDTFLSKKYPQLKYKIIVTLVCGKCFDRTKDYYSNSKKVEIYNIATLAIENEVFEEFARSILNIT